MIWWNIGPEEIVQSQGSEKRKEFQSPRPHLLQHRRRRPGIWTSCNLERGCVFRPLTNQQQTLVFRSMNVWIKCVKDNSIKNKKTLFGQQFLFLMIIYQIFFLYLTLLFWQNLCCWFSYDFLFMSWNGRNMLLVSITIYAGVANHTNAQKNNDHMIK